METIGTLGIYVTLQEAGTVDRSNWRTGAMIGRARAFARLGISRGIDHTAIEGVGQQAGSIGGWGERDLLDLTREIPGAIL